MICGRIEEMKIITDRNESEWNIWLKENGSQFLQSWEWGEILQSEDEEVEHLEIEDNGTIINQLLLVWKKMPYGMKYVFSPKSPVGYDKDVLRLISGYLKEKKAAFWRMEPDRAVEGIRLEKTIDLNPAVTLILDLTQNEDAILAQMKKNTRYSVRTAQTKELEISLEKDLESFWELLEKTASRDGFKTHSKKHYRAILESEISYQITAKKDGKPVASAIFVGFGDTMTYLFAASDHEKRDLLAPYLIQWEAIKLAKKLGFKKYDFFGIAPGDLKDGNYNWDEKHHYSGITRFKIGFGGEIVQTPGTFDLVFNPIKYQAYGLARKIRRTV
jgi:lipid II:glycine glycyltransferase (peptidoglycan interpeptide bridge formation enzyme)